MSWLNLNQSLNSLKGQITNFASEVLSEGIVEANAEETGETSAGDSRVQELERKCIDQEQEITALRKLNDDLIIKLHSEKKLNDVGTASSETDDSAWFWDPPATSAQTKENKNYNEEIQLLKKDISNLKEKTKNNVELNKLKEENITLKTSLEELDTQHNVAMEKLLTLKKGLQKNFEMLKEEYEELQFANENFKKEIDDLKKQLTEQDEDITTKADYETLHHKYVNLEKVHRVLQEQAEKFQEENQELNEDNFKLQEELTKLQHDLEMLQDDGSKDMIAKDKYDKLLQELSKLQENRTCTDEMQIDESNIDDNAKSLIENLKRDIADLKRRLNEAEKMRTPEASNDETESKLRLLIDKYPNLISPNSSKNSSINVINQIENIMQTLSSLKKEKAVLEQHVSEKGLQINDLQTQIDDLTSENEFLTSDLSHFDREMAEMKKNNDFLISEIAALKNASKLVPISESNEDNLVKLESELENCNMQKKSFESEIKIIREELLQVTKEKELLHNDLVDIKNKYKDLLAELEAYKSKFLNLQDMENASEFEINEKVKHLIHECEEYKSKINSFASLNEQLTIDKTIVENEKVLLLKDIDDLKRNLSKKNYALNEINAKKITLDHKIGELEKRLDEFLKDKVQMEHDKLALMENLKAMCFESGDSEINFENILAKLETKLKNLADINEEIAAIREENAELKKLQSKLMADNSELFEKLSLAAQKFSEKEATFKEQLESLKIQQNESNQTDYEQEIASLQSKIHNLDEVTNELELLRHDKMVLIETRSILEKELAIASDKINSIEANYSSLSGDLLSKDTTIHSLKEDLNKNNELVKDLNLKLSDVNQTLSLKENETMGLTTQIEDLRSNLKENEIRIIELETIIKSLEVKTASEADNVEKLEEVSKDLQIKSDLLSQKERELDDLREKILELETNAVNMIENSDAILVKDYESMKAEYEVVRHNHEAMMLDYENVKQQLEQAVKEKNELINLVTIKHNESLQYHAEIQRLNQVIHENNSQYQRIISEFKENPQNCNSCELLRQKIADKDEKIIEFSKNIELYESKLSEISYSTDLINNLSDKCESLDKSLTIQLDLVKNLSAENVQLKEQEQQLKKELERLRQHLVEIEESYTLELMVSEKKQSEYQQKLQSIEERAKQTSTLYTSNSIRANQEVETLRNQIRLLEKQRDDFQAKLSAAEDEHNRSRAALTNLQVVLEQFQLDKERDVDLATEKLRRFLREAEQKNLELKMEIQRLNSKVDESVAGLKAASRLGDQLEMKTAQIVDLKEQVVQLESSLKSAEEKYKNITSNQQDKVEKSLVKNLLINYINTQTKANDRMQVLKILSTVLDLNQIECEKIGLAKTQPNNQHGESLATEFVRFLEKESTRPNLPSMMGITNPGSGSARSSTPISRKNSGLGPQVDMGHKRQTSTGSNNLLFQNVESTNEDVEGPLNFQITSQTPDLIRPTAMLNLENSGVNQPRNTEGAILKNVLKDINN